MNLNTMIHSVNKFYYAISNLGFIKVGIQTKQD